MPDSLLPATSAGEELAKGERTRLRIVESACGLFLGQGYHGTSMRQIAQAAQIALGSIYNHFATKDEIFAAVLQTYHPWRQIPAALEAAQGETAEDVVRDAARRLLASWGEHSDWVRLHSIEQVEYQGRHLPRLYETTAAQVAQVAAGGSATRNIPTNLLLRALFGLFFAYLAGEGWSRAELPIDLGQSPVEFFADAYLQGLLGPAAPAEARPVTPRPAEAKPGGKWR